MSIINDGIDSVHKFSLIDIAIFKAYLIAVSLLGAILFPILLDPGFIAYFIAFIITLSFFFTSFFSKERSLIKHIKRNGFHFHLLRKANFLDISMFKLSMIFFGLAAASLFPVLLTADFFWYVGAFSFGVGYFIARVYVD